MDSAYSLYAAADREKSPERAEMLRRTASEAPIIRSNPLYPDQSPGREGQVTLTRVLANPRWTVPPIVGDRLTVLDGQGWLWFVEITEVLPERTDARNGWDVVESARGIAHGPPIASPMPAPVERDGKWTIVLPNMSGHAHVRSWNKSDIVRIGADTFEVTGNKKGENNVYTLAAASPEDYDTRPGRMRMSDESEARRAVGSCIPAHKPGEWLHVAKVGSVVTRAQFTSYTWYAMGRHVSADEAARINVSARGPLQSALAAIPGERVSWPMPADSVVLIPRDETSRAASGERLALVGGKILHERAGDPDQSDSWHHYVVEVTDPALVARAKIFLRKNKAKAVKA